MTTFTWFAVVLLLLHACATNAAQGQSHGSIFTREASPRRADDPTSANHFGSANGLSNTDGPIIACYYTPTSYFPVSRVPANVCTHIIYAFGIISTSPWSITAPSTSVASIWAQLTSLKRKNPQLKVLLSLQKGFPDVVGSDTDRMKMFATNSVKFLRQYQFDGVDMDWEFPKRDQKTAYATFFKIMRAAIENEAAVSGKPALLLSLSLPNNPTVTSHGFDLPTIASAVDFATAMMYDFHGYSHGDNLTGYNSPLYTPRGESKYLSASAMATYLVSSGFLASKLLLGVPTYGRSWMLASTTSHGLHSPAVGKGPPGPYRNISGIYLYPDACLALRQGAAQTHDSQNGAVYLYKGTTWVAYDDPITVTAKCEWVKKQGLGGVGVWALHLDDVDDICGAKSLPLINTMRRILLSTTGDNPQLLPNATRNLFDGLVGKLYMRGV